MAIEDMIYSNITIQRAYKNGEKIFERGDPYISRADNYQSSDPSYSKNTYIHVDDVDLMYNWKYEAEVAGLSDDPASRIWCFLGGSFNYDSSDYWLYPHLDGIFFGYKYWDYVTKETLSAQDMIDHIYQPRVDQDATIGDRHIITMKLNSAPTRHVSGTDYQMTIGGFHLLSARAGVTFSRDYITYNAGEAINIYMGAGSLYKNFGKVFRISIYDENDHLIHNYIPKKVSGHKGMFDTCTDKFYACTDDSKFIIANG